MNRRSVSIGSVLLPAASSGARLALALGGSLLVGACAAAAPPPSPSSAPIAVTTADPTPTAAPSPSQSTAPATPLPSPFGPRTAYRGPLETGTYITHPYRGNPITWQFTLPDGWTNGHDWFFYPTNLGGPDGKNEAGAYDGVAVAFLHNPEVFLDDCDFGGGMTDTDTVAELVAAIAAKNAWDVSKPKDVTIGGVSGQRLDVKLPADLSVCGEGSPLAFGEPATENGFFQMGPAQQLRVWVLDVDGQLIGLVRESFEASPADRIAEAEAILESSVITP